MARGYREMVDEAEAEIETLSVADARALLDDRSVQFVDVRDPRERDREGAVPGAMLAPRGMLEFWIDPDSPYHKDVFSSGKRLVFYCAAGWRSALATKLAQDMGLDDVAHIGSGFAAWRDADAPVEHRG